MKIAVDKGKTCELIVYTCDFKTLFLEITNRKDGVKYY